MSANSHKRKFGAIAHMVMRVVERTFGWMIRWRRLARDYQQRIDVSEAMIHVAMGSLLLRRIAH